MIQYAEYMVWGYPTMIHFFLVGVSGGALVISSFLFLREGRRRASLFTAFSIARYGAFIAPLAVASDVFMLIGELGHPERFMRVLVNVNFLSPMWVGSWLIAFLAVVSIPYAFTYLALPNKEGLLRRVMAWCGVPENVGPDDKWEHLRRTIAKIGVPLGITLSLYPGMMLGTLQGRPFWNTALLPLVFMCSSMATALAAILLCRIVFRKTLDPLAEREYGNHNYLLAATSVGILAAEALVLSLIFVFAQLTGGNFAHAVEVTIAPGGVLATEFWLGVMVVGLLVPIIVGVLLIGPKLFFGRPYAASREVEAIMPTAVLIGGFMLFDVVLVGGQITAPVGV